MSETCDELAFSSSLFPDFDTDAGEATCGPNRRPAPMTRPRCGPALAEGLVVAALGWVGLRRSRPVAGPKAAPRLLCRSRARPPCRRSCFCRVRAAAGPQHHGALRLGEGAAPPCLTTPPHPPAWGPRGAQAASTHPRAQPEPAAALWAASSPAPGAEGVPPSPSRHCVHLLEGEAEILMQHGASIAHCAPPRLKARPLPPAPPSGRSPSPWSVRGPRPPCG